MYCNRIIVVPHGINDPFFLHTHLHTANLLKKSFIFKFFQAEIIFQNYALSRINLLR